MPHPTKKHTINRAELKKKARGVVKTNYLFLLFTCLFAALIGSEFSDSLTIFHSQSAELSTFVQLPTALLEGSRQVFGQSRGVFAGLITTFNSGSFFDTIFNVLNSVLHSEGVSAIVLILLGLLSAFVFWFFIGNVYRVVSRRIFLESRLYKHVTPDRFLFLHSVKKWRKVSVSMFVLFLYLLLWSCVFLVGGIIKRYSYFLVPFLLAENPNFSPNEAITLSRKMMHGHKWACFKLEFSFLGWMILRLFTLGLSGLFYSNAYQTAAYTEFYVQMRTRAKENGLAGTEALCDVYLYEKANTALLQETYADVATVLNAPKTQTKPKGKLETALGFVGIALHRTKDDEEQELAIVRENNVKEFKDILSAEQYPARLSPLLGRAKKIKHETSNYMKKYSIPTLILMFFIFCFIGWAWEVTLYLIKDGVFVNRGTMYGPWLPIYGGGGFLILTLLYRLRKNVLVQFFATVVLCGIVEYTTAYVLELTHNGTKWWDYSGYFLNFQGRVCGEGLLVFGLGGIAVVYLLAPLLDDLINKANQKLLVVLSCVLLILFTLDALYASQHPNAGEGITSGSAVEVSEAASSLFIHPGEIPFFPLSS